jgi:hypothetical protein
MAAVLLWLAGLYLRIPLLVAPALAPFIADELMLSQALTGALTTLPVLMLAVGSMPGSLAISRFGPRNTLALSLVIVALGSASRGLAPDMFVLMAASAVMGLGISIQIDQKFRCQLRPVIVVQHWREVQLQVWYRLLGPGADEPAGLGAVARQYAPPTTQVLRQAQQSLEPVARMHRDALTAAIADAHEHVDMVLEVLPDALQRMTQLYAISGQFLPRTDPGQHQQLRRVERAAAELNFAPGTDLRQLGRHPG